MADDIPQMKEARPPLPLEFSLLWTHGSRASVEEGMNHEKHEIHEGGGIIEPRMGTNGHEYLFYRE